MRKFMIAATAVLALAAPTAALAGGATGVSTNGNNSDYLGYCVSAGNTNYHAAGQTTGQDRSALNQTGAPGAVASLIHTAQEGTICGPEVPFAPPASVA
jgi:hypothetical protein